MLHKTYALIIWSSLVVVSNNKLHYKTAETNNHIYHFVLTKENCTKKAITLAAFYMILTFSWYNILCTHELWTPCEGKEVPAKGSSLRPFLGDPDISLAIHTKGTKGTGPVRRLGKIEHGTSRPSTELWIWSRWATLYHQLADERRLIVMWKRMSTRGSRYMGIAGDGFSWFAQK